MYVAHSARARARACSAVTHVSTAQPRATRLQVNGDKSMEWEELLEYVVQTVGASVQVGDVPSGGTSAAKRGGADTVSTGPVITPDAAAVARFSYQPVPPPLHAAISPDEQAAAQADDGEGASALVAQLFDDVFDDMQVCVDPITDDKFVLAYRRGSTTVEIMSWMVADADPSLQPLKRFRHGTALYSHFVLYATFVREARMLASCSRQSDDTALSANFYDFDTMALRRRVTIDYPALAIAYSQQSHAICFCAAATGVVYLFDVYSLDLTRTVHIGEAGIHACLSLCTYSVDIMLLGLSNGNIVAVDDRSWKPIPGASVLAHEFGVRALAYSDRYTTLVSIGHASPKRVSGSGEDVYAVLMWDIHAWNEKAPSQSDMKCNV
ncbi:MAG: hypothetical protein EOO65_02030 [Methanosarcinales archaeon]|nr:MAG: hypothetical protein EOO65_02030 [Methanosarcinales archaeon]